MKINFNWLYYKDKVQELTSESFFAGFFAMALFYDLTNQKWLVAIFDLVMLVWAWRQMKSSAKYLRG